jgi:hypothetical protein
MKKKRTKKKSRNWLAIQAFEKKAGLMEKTGKKKNKANRKKIKQKLKKGDYNEE